MKNIAVRVFKEAPDRLNCAQAVIHAYRFISGDHSLHPEDYKTFGGGRTPEGVCGALYAACQAGEKKAELISKIFENRAGSTKCKELKGKAVPCKMCVEIAAEVLGESMIG